MHEVEEWLEKLGLSEYAQRFAENNIDFSVLTDLNDLDLKELGIASLGHRRKMLRAIGEFAGNSTSNVLQPPKGASSTVTFTPPKSYSQTHLAEQAATARGAIEGERKQATVLFCDIANLTALAERIGAEAMHALLNKFFEFALGECATGSTGCARHSTSIT